MDVRNFVVNQLAHQDLGTFTNGLRCLKNFPSFDVPPPTTSNGSARNRLREAGDRTTCGLEHDSMTLHESDSFCRIHFNLLENDNEQQTRLCVPNDSLGSLQYSLSRRTFQLSAAVARLDRKGLA